MDFGLSEEQRMLEDALRRFLQEKVPTPRVREITEGAEGFDGVLWGGLAELGITGLLVPEELGGSGLALLDAAIASESLGWAATPAPFLAAAVMAPVVLRAAGSPDQQREWLPRIATGEARLAVAATETYSRREGAEVRVEGDRLVGKALFAIDVTGATAFLVATLDGSLALVPREAAGLAVTPLPTVDRTRRVGELAFDGVPVADWVGGRAGAGAAIARMLDAGRLAVAADALGACERAVEMAVAYAKQRKQFGRLIGSFQAVKHLCADMVAELEPARSLLWYAAHAFDAVPDESALVTAHAKAHLSEVARDIVRIATEVHGGIGFTDEHDLHLWFKRANLDRQLLGSPETLRARAARLRGWDAE